MLTASIILVPITSAAPSANTFEFNSGTTKRRFIPAKKQVIQTPVKINEPDIQVNKNIWKPKKNVDLNTNANKIAKIFQNTLKGNFTIAKDCNGEVLLINQKILSNGEISFIDQKILGISNKGTSQQNNKNLQGKADVKIDFDSNPLKKFAEEIPYLKGVLTFGEDVYFEKNSKKFFIKIRNLKLDITDGDKEIVDIVSGFAELIKFANNEYIYDLNELGYFFDKIKKIDPNADFDQKTVERLLKVYEDPMKLYPKMIQVVLKSGLFEINKAGNIYKITLSQNLDYFNPEPIIDYFMQMMFLPVNEKKLIKTEIMNEIPHMMPMAQAIWPEILKSADEFQIEIITSENKIQAINTNIILNFKKDVNLVAKWKGNINFKNGSSVIKIPENLRDGIDFIKFMKGMMSIAEMENKKGEGHY